MIMNCDWICENRSYRPWQEVWFYHTSTIKYHCHRWPEQKDLLFLAAFFKHWRAVRAVCSLNVWKFGTRSYRHWQATTPWIFKTSISWYFEMGNKTETVTIVLFIKSHSLQCFGSMFRIISWDNIFTHAKVNQIGVEKY